MLRKKLRHSLQARMMILVLPLVSNHASRAVNNLVRTDALMILEILTSKDIEAILALYRFLLAVELEVFCLVFSFNLNLAILTWYLNFATFFVVVLCEIFSRNDVFAKIANDQGLRASLEMFNCLVGRSSAQSIQATKWTEELLVATDLSMSQQVLVTHRLPLWTPFILTFDTGLLQNRPQFAVEGLNLKVFSTCWTGLTGHQPFSDAMLAINLLAMAAFLGFIDHSFAYGAFEILNDFAIRARSVRNSVSLFLVGYNYHFLVLF